MPLFCLASVCCDTSGDGDCAAKDFSGLDASRRRNRMSVIEKWTNIPVATSMQPT